MCILSSSSGHMISQSLHLVISPIIGAKLDACYWALPSHADLGAKGQISFSALFQT